MKTYLSIWTSLLLLAIGMVVFSEFLNPEAQAKLMKEGGLIETASWISYFVAAFFVLLKMFKSPNRWSMLVGVMLLGMRELDFDKRFTAMGIFKSRFYSSADVPVGEKLIGVLVTAAIVVTLFFLVKNHLKPFISRVMNREGASLSFFFAGGLMVFAKSIDGLSRKLEPLGIEPTDATNRIVESVEESFELTAALLVVVAAAGALRHRSK